jgi:hypothetical protein
MEQRFAASFVGDTVPVLWEHVSGATQDGFINVGYTDCYVRVRCIHPRVLTNHITPARVDSYDPVQQAAQVSPILEPVDG